MPTYSYACTDCDNRFDVVQAFTDETLTTCGQCSGRLRKLFGSIGVVFKGSGFYRTDSRDSARGSTNGSAKSAPTDTAPAASSDKSTTSDKSSSAAAASSSSDSSASSATPAAAAAS